MRCPRWVFQGMKYSGWPKTTKGSTSVCLKELVIIPCVGDISGYRLDSLCFLSFWNRHDRSGTYTHTHGCFFFFYSSSSIVWTLKSPRSYFLSLSLFFLLTQCRNKTQQKIPSLHVSPFRRPLPTFFFGLSIIIIIIVFYLFICVGCIQSQFSQTLETIVATRGNIRWPL